MVIVAVALAVASVSYAASIALGILVATRRVDSSGFHWLHHALYVSTFVLAAAAIVAAWWRHPLVGWLLLPAVVPFASIPFLGTRGARHPIAGLVPAPFYVLAAIALLS
ncbi:hypothetical protein ACFOYW_01825 [Gryllotalpicola reticulitermitis]|uniref:Uncharacterized protein n=1 Tax=Gryllotalpicola reticulitermitis TaxID=1184153 RepID=A0ABV8Q3U4_9MICO